MVTRSVVGVQVKLARIGLGWTQEELGERAQVSRNTIRAIELDYAETRPNNRDAVVQALLKGGASFASTPETVTVHFERSAVEPPSLVLGDRS